MKAIIRIIILVTISALLMSCGGSNAGSSAAPAVQRGTFEVKVIWPAANRLLPVDSQSVLATLTNATGATLGAQLLAKPAQGNTITLAEFTNVPAGTVTLSASAYPTANGTGVAQAVGSSQGTVVAGQTTTVNVTMADTIVRVVITPASPSIVAGATQQLTMTAYDAANDVVLTSPTTVTWNSGTTADATISSSGLLTGVSQGSSLITVTETESGKSGTTTATITAGTGGLNGTIQ